MREVKRLQKLYTRAVESPSHHAYIANRNKGISADYEYKLYVSGSPRVRTVVLKHYDTVILYIHANVVIHLGGAYSPTDVRAINNILLASNLHDDTGFHGYHAYTKDGEVYLLRPENERKAIQGSVEKWEKQVESSDANAMNKVCPMCFRFEKCVACPLISCGDLFANRLRLCDKYDELNHIAIEVKTKLEKLLKYGYLTKHEYNYLPSDTQTHSHLNHA